MAESLPAGALNVRMYNVGFGDCFLLSFPVGQGHRHVLVDCGAHPKGSLGNLAAVAEHVHDVCGGELAAVIATHRHQDHIWGFERGQDTFRKLRIGEVWLPWVEDPDDDQARALWRAHAKARAALEARLAAAPAGPRRDAIAAVLANLKPNEVALSGLKSAFGAGRERVRYLKGGQPDLESPLSIPGLRVVVLGPPTDAVFLRKMDPPKSEGWGKVAAAPASGKVAPLGPFDDRWTDPGGAAYWHSEPSGVFGKEERTLFRDAMGDELDLAFAMEDAVNNSSLALLFLFHDEGLLMPGDAQWGNWSYWINQPMAPQFFDRITLYKVGHHGSLNATPHSIVGRLPEEVAVMLPTMGGKPFPTIPDGKLVLALQERSKGSLARSDETGKLPAPFLRGEFWIDYRVEAPGQ